MECGGTAAVFVKGAHYNDHPMYQVIKPRMIHPVAYAGLSQAHSPRSGSKLPGLGTSVRKSVGCFGQLHGPVRVQGAEGCRFSSVCRSPAHRGPVVGEGSKREAEDRHS